MTLRRALGLAGQVAMTALIAWALVEGRWWTAVLLLLLLGVLSFLFGFASAAWLDMRRDRRPS